MPVVIRPTALARPALLSALLSGLLTWPAAAQAPAPGPADPLTGVWESATEYGPALGGELSVACKKAAKDSDCQARLAGRETRFRSANGAIRFAFGAKGGFRGRLASPDGAIEGFWLQPALGMQQPYASPLTLKPAGPGEWRGVARPMAVRFTLWLKIDRGPDGALVAAFRNPENNSRGGAAQFQVTRTADTVRFSARPDPARPEIALAATLTAKPDRLSLVWPDLRRKVTLTRRTAAQAAAFYPRPPGSGAYAYSQPPVTGDGWDTADPGAVGMDRAALSRLVQRLIEADPAARRPGLIHSVLVARHGKLVLEEYFYGFDRDTPHDSRSAGKTFAAVMLGAAMRGGVAIGPDTSIYGLMAARGPFAHADPRKATITLGQLMTHTSGLACDDNDNDSPGNEETMQSQAGQPDWWKYTLDLPMAHDPGSRYAYCSANLNLVGGALTTATATWLPALFDREVARPLQFGSYYWNLQPDGEGYQGGGVFLRPRDLLKVGQAWLDGGVWHGHRIADRSWVELSTAPHMHISPATTGLDPKDFPNFYGEADDGYAWHLAQVRAGGRTYRDYAATGNGGQLLIVIPEHDLVVVFTAGNYGQGGIWGRFRDQITPNDIVGAIRD